MILSVGLNETPMLVMVSGKKRLVLSVTVILRLPWDGAACGGVGC